MVLDVVATRDIGPDEEIFIDYGAEWEMAWNAHVDNYGTPCQSEPARQTSHAIFSMNENKFNKDHLTWSDDHFTVCKERKIIAKDTFLIVADKDEALRNPISIDGFTLPVLESFTSITRSHIGFNLTEMRGPDFEGRVPCMMVGAMNETEAIIDVVYFVSHAGLSPNTLFRVFRLPAAELDIIPMPFKSDTFHKKSFRHPIKIPDDVFPEHWKDNPQTTPVH
jgi:hypothetical protein